MNFEKVPTLLQFGYLDIVTEKEQIKLNLLN
jgi:hypothetical protein